MRLELFDNYNVAIISNKSREEFAVGKDAINEAKFIEHKGKKKCSSSSERAFDCEILSRINLNKEKWKQKKADKGRDVEEDAEDWEVENLTPHLQAKIQRKKWIFSGKKSSSENPQFQNGSRIRKNQRGLYRCKNKLNYYKWTEEAFLFSSFWNLIQRKSQKRISCDLSANWKKSWKLSISS